MLGIKEKQDQHVSIFYFSSTLTIMLLVLLDDPVYLAWGNLQATYKTLKCAITQDILTFVEAQEAWVKSKIGVGHVYAEATKCGIGLHHTIAGIRPCQFAIIAEEDLHAKGPLQTYSTCQPLLCPQCTGHFMYDYTYKQQSHPEGEEIMVSYGPGFWTEDSLCLCSICLGPQPLPRWDENIVQQKKTKEA
ncbi:hypothetical protein B0H13DRAFT_1909701 [Mycena leptocephala]|nr:hypothetical protein B0H13DRAFT_1909701 [Mycena leptocephala]